MKSLCLSLVALGGAADTTTFTVVDGWNAVPSGSMKAEASLSKCQSLCTGLCTQFSWNKNSHHCYTSTDTEWKGDVSDHVTSGCRADTVDGCGSTPAPSPTPPSPQFDGVLRENGKGRMDAYLPPPYESNHASMVEQLPNGALSMAWFSGTKEGSNDVAIVYSQLNASAKSGEQWSAAKVLSRRDGYSNQNAVLYFDNTSSKLHLFHSQQLAKKGESRATVWHLQAHAPSGVVGQFTAAHEILSLPGSFNKNRVLPLLDGSLLLPIYEQGKSPNYPTNAFLPPGADADDATAWTQGNYGSDCDNMVQPSVVRPKPGQPNLIAFFRDRKKRNIYTASSPDDGKTWTSCKATSLPNNNAGIEAYAMRSGRIAMVYNPQTTSRDPLSISLSEDDGKTWKYTRILEQLDGKQEFSYPTLREDVALDGVIHVSYTFKRQCIKHSVVSEEWVMSSSELLV